MCEMEGLLTVKDLHEKFHGLYPDAMQFNRMQTALYRELFQEDNSVALVAPCGSGKTYLFEFAIMKSILSVHVLNMRCSNLKLVYIASAITACEERFVDWQSRFGTLDMSNMLVTRNRDEIDMNTLRQANMVFTTPEYWENITRCQEGFAYIQQVSLLLLDEVQVLSDAVRGPLLEIIVNRMRWARRDSGPLRFVAISASMPSMNDVAEWLTSPYRPCRVYHFGDEVRPLRLRKLVLGYASTSYPPDFRFDISLSYKLSDLIHQYSCGKPTLIYCSTRRSVELTAKEVTRTCKLALSCAQVDSLQRASIYMQSPTCKAVVAAGIGCYHGGLPIEDRLLMERLYRDGTLPIIISTASLATSLTLPAYLIIVKNTWRYSAGKILRLCDMDVHQCIGRAGRAKRDDDGMAIILTTCDDKEKYDNFQTPDPVESSLQECLPEMFNCELALGTLTDMNSVYEHLKTTFFYVRARKNPKHYALAKDSDAVNVEKGLGELCISVMNKLLHSGLIMHVANNCLACTQNGGLMCKYSLSLKTFRSFNLVERNYSISTMLYTICAATEFQCVPLRHYEKCTLNKLNSMKHKDILRYGLETKVVDDAMKANCLIQASFGCLDITDPSLRTDAIELVKRGQNVVNCLVELTLKSPDFFQSALSACILQKCFTANMWENSTFVARQCEGITNADAKKLSLAGITNFRKISATDIDQIAEILEKDKSVAKQLVRFASGMPNYEMNVMHTDLPKSNIKLVVTIRLMNASDIAFAPNPIVPPESAMILMIGNITLNTCIHYEQIRHGRFLEEPKWEKEIIAPMPKKVKTAIGLNFISLKVVGIDRRAEINLYENLNTETLLPFENKHKSRQVLLDSFFKPTTSSVPTFHPFPPKYQPTPPKMVVEEPPATKPATPPPPIYEMIRASIENRPARTLAECTPPKQRKPRAPKTSTSKVKKAPLTERVDNAKNNTEETPTGVDMQLMGEFLKMPQKFYKTPTAVPQKARMAKRPLATPRVYKPIAPHPPPQPPAPIIQARPPPVPKSRPPPPPRPPTPPPPPPPFCKLHLFAHYGECQSVIRPIRKSRLKSGVIDLSKSNQNSPQIANPVNKELEVPKEPNTVNVCDNTATEQNTRTLLDNGPNSDTSAYTSEINENAMENLSLTALDEMDAYLSTITAQTSAFASYNNMSFSEIAPDAEAPQVAVQAIPSAQQSIQHIEQLPYNAPSQSNAPSSHTNGNNPLALIAEDSFRMNNPEMVTTHNPFPGNGDAQTLAFPSYYNLSNSEIVPYAEAPQVAVQAIPSEQQSFQHIQQLPSNQFSESYTPSSHANGNNPLALIAEDSFRMVMPNQNNPEIVTSHNPFPGNGDAQTLAFPSYYNLSNSEIVPYAEAAQVAVQAIPSEQQSFQHNPFPGNGDAQTLAFPSYYNLTNADIVPYAEAPQVAVQATSSEQQSFQHIPSNQFSESYTPSSHTNGNNPLALIAEDSFRMVMPNQNNPEIVTTHNPFPGNGDAQTLAFPSYYNLINSEIVPYAEAAQVAVQAIPSEQQSFQQNPLPGNGDAQTLAFPSYYNLINSEIVPYAEAPQVAVQAIPSEQQSFQHIQQLPSNQFSESYTPTSHTNGNNPLAIIAEDSFRIVMPTPSNPETGIARNPTPSPATDTFMEDTTQKDPLLNNVTMQYFKRLPTIEDKSNPPAISSSQKSFESFSSIDPESLAVYHELEATLCLNDSDLPDLGDDSELFSFMNISLEDRQSNEIVTTNTEEVGDGLCTQVTQTEPDMPSLNTAMPEPSPNFEHTQNEQVPVNTKESYESPKPSKIDQDGDKKEDGTESGENLFVFSYGNEANSRPKRKCTLKSSSNRRSIRLNADQQRADAFLALCVNSRQSGTKRKEDKPSVRKRQQVVELVPRSPSVSPPRVDENTCVYPQATIARSGKKRKRGTAASRKSANQIQDAHVSGSNDKKNARKGYALTTPVKEKESPEKRNEVDCRSEFSRKFSSGGSVLRKVTQSSSKRESGIQPYPATRARDFILAKKCQMTRYNRHSSELQAPDNTPPGSPSPPVSPVPPEELEIYKKLAKRKTIIDKKSKKQVGWRSPIEEFMNEA